MSVLPAGLGALWTMGLLGWLSYELSVISVLAPIFTVVMGSADGLHFISHVQDEIKAGKRKEKALSSTLAKVGKPMIMTTLTTVAGFLSLLVVNSEPMRQLAISAGIGITFAGIATWVFLPVVCMFIKNPGMTKTGPGLDPITPLFGKTIGRRSVIITLIISIVFLPGIFLIQTDLNMINLYKKSTRVRRSIEKITDITGGAIPVFIEFSSEKDPISPAVADRVLRMEEQLLESQSVTKTVSLFNIFSALNHSVFGAEERAYPDKPARANLMFTIFQQNQPEQVKSTLLRESKTGRLVVFPRSLSNRDLQKIQDIAAESGGEGVEFSVVGTPYIMKEMNERIIPDQLSSIFLAVFMVFVLMWFALRSFRMALIGVVPLATTLIALFGFMGFASIELSVITSTMASITIGVGIDYAVHFTSLFKTFLKNHDAQKAAKMAFDYVSKPVLANALGLAIGLSALLLSPLQFHTYMSLLMWVTMLVSSFVSLTFLPTLLSKVFSRKGQKR